MEDRETARMRKYGESETTRIMMATVPHVTSGLGLREFQVDGFLLTPPRVYMFQLKLEPSSGQLIVTTTYCTKQGYYKGIWNTETVLHTHTHTHTHTRIFMTLSSIYT